MRFFVLAALLAALFTITIAKPLPFDMEEIQRRWSQGETEATIHAADTHRDATPAWPILRKGDERGAFAYATDERTMELRRLKHQKRDSPSRSSLQSFVEKFYRGRGETSMVAKRDLEEAPVLKPRKSFRYQWNA